MKRTEFTLTFILILLSAIFHSSIAGSPPPEILISDFNVHTPVTAPPADLHHYANIPERFSFSPFLNFNLTGDTQGKIGDQYISTGNRDTVAKYFRAQNLNIQQKSIAGGFNFSYNFSETVTATAGIIYAGTGDYNFFGTHLGAGMMSDYEDYIVKFGIGFMWQGSQIDTKYLMIFPRYNSNDEYDYESVTGSELTQNINLYLSLGFITKGNSDLKFYFSAAYMGWGLAGSENSRANAQEKPVLKFFTATPGLLYKIDDNLAILFEAGIYKSFAENFGSSPWGIVPSLRLDITL